MQSSKCDKLDAYIPYIAMNTFDRFISRHQLPVLQIIYVLRIFKLYKVRLSQVTNLIHECNLFIQIVLGKVRDDLDLTAHCCLLMAWKFTDIFSFSLEEFVVSYYMRCILFIYLFLSVN